MKKSMGIKNQYESIPLQKKTEGHSIVILVAEATSSSSNKVAHIERPLQDLLLTSFTYGAPMNVAVCGERWTVQCGYSGFYEAGGGAKGTAGSCYFVVMMFQHGITTCWFIVSLFHEDPVTNQTPW
ncbi:LOW QUALITY PROTEIN: hypothetical protein ACHAW6_003567 [Cyclotella cf. meneghiniana]